MPSKLRPGSEDPPKFHKVRLQLPPCGLLEEEIGRFQSACSAALPAGFAPLDHENVVRHFFPP